MEKFHFQLLMNLQLIKLKKLIKILAIKLIALKKMTALQKTIQKKTIQKMIKIQKMFQQFQILSIQITKY